MKKTILIGPTDLWGLLRYAPEIIGVGRSPLPNFLENQFVQIKDLNFSP